MNINQFTQLHRFVSSWRGYYAMLGVVLSLSINTAHAETLVLNDTNLVPYTTIKGDGFLDIIAGMAFKQAGLELRLVRLPAERGLRNANLAIDDGDLTRIKGIEKNYPNLVRVPEKLVDWEFVAFSRNHNIISDWKSLEDYNIGYIKGWKIFENKTRDFKYVQQARDAQSLFVMLDRDRIHVALFSRWMGLSFLRQLHIKGIHVLEPPLAKKEMYIYLNKKHRHHVANIAAALKKLKQSGEYERLFKEKVLDTQNKNN